jgi:hypothetical protein
VERICPHQALAFPENRNVDVSGAVIEHHRNNVRTDSSSGDRPCWRLLWRRMVHASTKHHGHKCGRHTAAADRHRTPAQIWLARSSGTIRQSGFDNSRRTRCASNRDNSIEPTDSRWAGAVRSPSDTFGTLRSRSSCRSPSNCNTLRVIDLTASGDVLMSDWSGAFFEHARSTRALWCSYPNRPGLHISAQSASSVREPTVTWRTLPSSCAPIPGTSDSPKSEESASAAAPTSRARGNR